MFYLLVYDIEDNKLRTRLAKHLERRGGMRIQKSVFIFELSEAKYQLLLGEMRHLHPEPPIGDSILIFAMDKDHIKEAARLGANYAFEEAIQQINTLFF